MRDAELFERILDLEVPWSITRVDINTTERRVDVFAVHAANALVVCPKCQSTCRMVQAQDEERIWRQSGSCHFQTFLHARVPRIRCDSDGVRRVPVPWSRLPAMPRFDEIRSDIEMDLSVIRVIYRDRLRRAAVLDLLRRARFLLLNGDLGVPGMLRAILRACEDAADRICAGSKPEVAMRDSIRAMAEHGLRVSKRGGKERLLHTALLTDTAAMAALTVAAKHIARPNRHAPYKGLTRERINVAATAVGLQSSNRKATRKSRRPGDESAEARAVAKSIHKAAKLAAEDDD